MNQNSPKGKRFELLLSIPNKNENKNEEKEKTLEILVEYNGDLAFYRTR